MINHDIDDLQARLAEGEVRLIFLKKDGSTRDARGTRAPDLIPYEDHPKGIKTPSIEVLCFYDLDKGAWRSLRRENLLGFIEN